MTEIIEASGFAINAEDAELSAEELEAVAGGADRDWLTDGCAATVEPGSWCGSNDWGFIWSVTYTMVILELTICIDCGHKEYDRTSYYMG